MRHNKEEQSYCTEQVIDLVSAVKGLHTLNSQELNKLLRDSENFTLQYTTEKGPSLQIDAEKLAGFLPLHLIAVLISSDKDEALFKYLLCGLRLLHSLCDLAPRQNKLEQILLDDVKVSEQLLDLVFALLIVLGSSREEHQLSSHAPLLHSALVACSLYLLTGFISTQWQDLGHVLTAHPKVDIFMEAAFRAVHLSIRSLQIKLSAQCVDFPSPAEQVVNSLCQQCEASLQFLQSLCQQKMFRERLLKNKELCGKGGVLLLAQAILKLCITPLFKESSTIVAAVSRLKAKVLSIVLCLCEAESISYLDEVASYPGSLDLAKSIALEVLELLKTAFGGDQKYLSGGSEKTHPTGLLQLNAMRLADIFSDDSNFRSFITVYFTEVLAAIFSLPHGEFLSSWCSSDLPVREEDASLEYDPFVAAGWVLDSFSSPDLLNLMSSESTFIQNNMSQAPYAHQRTSLLVKVIANLHCFVPNICEEQEKDLFLHKCLECLQMERPRFSFSSDAQKAATVCKNLRSLLGHAESLIPLFLNEEDVQLLRVFFKEIQSLITPTELEESKLEGSMSWDKFSRLDIGEHHQEAQSTGGCSSPLLRKAAPDVTNRSANLKEGTSENSTLQEVDQFFGRNMDQADDVMRQDRRKDKNKLGRALRDGEKDVQNVETSGSDSSSTRGKNSTDQIDNSEFPKSNEHIKASGSGGVQEDEKVEIIPSEEKQRRKRKRTIMNDTQMTLIEKALVDEPDMQRNAALIQSWADKLSFHGPELTASQLKNWLNNRKARLARAAKDVRVASEVDSTFPDKQVGSGVGSLHDSPESPGEDFFAPSTARGGTHQSAIGGSVSRAGADNAEAATAELVDINPAELVRREPGQYVVLLDGQGDDIGKGKVHQVQGKWYGKNLEESQTCVVDVMELKAERWSRLPHPSETTGTSFDEAETKLGVMRVSWDLNKLCILRSK